MTQRGAEPEGKGIYSTTAPQVYVSSTLQPHPRPRPPTPGIAHGSTIMRGRLLYLMTDEGRSPAPSDLLHTPTRCLPQTESQQEAGEAEMVPPSLSQPGTARARPGQALLRPGGCCGADAATSRPGRGRGPAHGGGAYRRGVTTTTSAWPRGRREKGERDGVTMEIEVERLPLSRHGDTTTPPCTTQDPAAGVGVDQPAGEGGIWPR